MIHAAFLAWLYHTHLPRPLEEPEDLIPVEIIVHEESPVYAQVERIIQPTFSAKKGSKSQNLTFIESETDEWKALRPLPMGEKTEPELILPVKGDEPSLHYTAKDQFNATPLQSKPFTTERRPYRQNRPFLQPAQDPVTPSQFEIAGNMVTAGFDSLKSIQQNLGFKKTSQLETIHRFSPEFTNHLFEPLTDPKDKRPYIPFKMEMTFAKVNYTSLPSVQKFTPKHQPDIISLTILGCQPMERQKDSSLIFIPNNELVLLHKDYLPSFLLPGSPHGVNFLLAIDTSGSVKGAPLKGIKKSAHDFVNLMGPKDLAGIITFDDSVRITGSFTADKAVLHKKIDSLRPTGTRTVLYDALPEAIEMMKKKDGKTKFIVLFSDGKDEGSQTSLENAIAALSRSDISILAVGYTRVEKKYLKIMSTIAVETGGIFVHTPQFRDMINLYRLSQHDDAKLPIVESTQKKATETISLFSLAEQFKAIKGSKDAQFFRMWTRKKIYKIGDSIEYHFQSNQNCHVIIILFSSSGEIMQVFPNRFYPDSYISAGIRYNIPSPNSDILLEVSGPAGKDELVAIISNAPMQIFPINSIESPFFVIDETDRSLLKQIQDNLQRAKEKDFMQKRAQYMIEK